MTNPDPTDVSRAEQIVYMTDWAAANKALLETNGEVGFGRDCVGIVVDGHYIDTDVQYDGGEWWEPQDSYHKHDCLAVLGHGDGPLRQLYDWVKWLDEHGLKVVTETRQPANQIDLIFHGITASRLVRS